MKPTNDTILIEKVFNASIKKTWNAWTDPVLIMKWFGSDPDGVVLKAILEVRPGGHFEITFRDSDLTEHTCNGVYIEVDEHRKLSFTWMWKSEPGVESLVTIVLTADENNTIMQFEHANIGSTSKHQYLKGWQDTFYKLEKMLTT